MSERKIKISPSIKSGSHHWLMQRVSAIALIFLTIWLVSSIIKIIHDPLNYMTVFFAYPFNAVMGILFVATSLYHGSLGMKVIIEDYVSCKAARHCFIISINFISIFVGFCAILSILRLHLIG